MIDWVSVTPAWLHPFPDPCAMWMTAAWFFASFGIAYSVRRVTERTWVRIAVGAVLLLGGLWLGVLPLSLTILGLLGVLWMECGVIIN